MSEGISVIIPAYNYQRYVSEALNSVLSQTHSYFEILLVDDGSTDDTRKIVSKFADPRIRYIFQTNQGLSAARNTGILNARFDYVAFLDADDLWLPGMLEAASGRFSRLSAEYGLVACGSVRITENGSAIDVPKSRARQEERDYRAEDIVLKSRFMPSTVVARSEVFKNVGNFDTNLRSSEDRDMWIRIAAKYRLRYYTDPMVQIRKHDNNMSKNADRMRLNMRKVLGKRFRQGLRSPAEIILRLKALSFHYFEVAWMYYDEHRRLEAFSSLTASLLLWPLFAKPQQDLDRPFLFRLRALAHFIAGLSNLGRHKI